MKNSKITFWDDFQEAAYFENFYCGESKIHMAASPAGVGRFRNFVSEKTPLCLWVKNKGSLLDLLPAVSNLPSQFFFSYSGLKPSEIIKYGSFTGPIEMELPDFRIKDPGILDPAVTVLQKAESQGLELSVIIPLFDNSYRAKKALSCWFQQQHPSYEIILVDDGSSDQWIDSLIGEHREKLTLLRLSREQKRERGDSHFRAGIARNCGTHAAQGESFIFCDSDILVPPDFLDKMTLRLKNADLVMPLRWQLCEAASENFRTYQDLSFERDVVLSPGAYWEHFQMRENSWQDLPAFWKWTSSFCFGISRKCFVAAGGFKKTFVTYGFEDTELGYRLHKMNMRFEILPLNTYHLFQPATHSEYHNDVRKKERLLKISADRFFRHHPVKEVYQALQKWLD